MTELNKFKKLLKELNIPYIEKEIIHTFDNFDTDDDEYKTESIECIVIEINNEIRKNESKVFSFDLILNSSSGGELSVYFYKNTGKLLCLIPYTP